MKMSKSAFKRLSFVCVFMFIAAWGMDAETARDWYLVGRSSLNNDDLHSALDAFRSAITLNPDYGEAHLGMAEGLFLLGEYFDAYSRMEQARPYSAGNRDYILLEARILTALKRYDEAVSLYQSILDEYPHDYRANGGLAEVYAILGQRERADQKYAKSLQHAPGNLRVLLQLVILHDRSKEKPAAEKYLLEALRRHPQSLYLHLEAARHYSLYSEWDSASRHFDLAKGLLNGPQDRRYTDVARLDASLQLRRGDPDSALRVLESIPIEEDPELLFFKARAHRQSGNETLAQDLLDLLLRINPYDEIVRIYRETPLVQSISGFETFRSENAVWHMERARRQQEDFYYKQALFSLRRARKIDSTNAQIWLAYANLILLKGFPLKYRDELEAAIFELATMPEEQEKVQKRRDLFRHSEEGDLADKWGIDEPWNIRPTAWNTGVFVLSSGLPLLYHEGAKTALASYFADLIDTYSQLHVYNFDGGLFPVAKEVDSTVEAFRQAQNTADYFILLDFSETQRSFTASATLYLARNGEQILTISQIRDGEQRVADAINLLAQDVASMIPQQMSVIAMDGERVLLDKGRWHDIPHDASLLVLRQGSARPAAGESGIEYADFDVIGTIELSSVSESISEGYFNKSGDFNYLSIGDQAFAAPIPTDQPDMPLPNPAFRSRLLSIP